MIFDIDDQLIEVGDRVVAIDRVQGIRLRIGEVMGFTDKGVKVDFKDDPKTYNKQPHQLVKMFNQKKKHDPDYIDPNDYDSPIAKSYAKALNDTRTYKP